ncbi:MAG TPA: YciI family protein [Caulobacteraceae bacterium]|jgi:hypothetical protein
MRFMVQVRSNAKIESGAMPEAELLEAMGRFNQELIDAGMMVAGEGLHPSSKGARISFQGATPVVTDGPFAETKELIAGFWIIKAKSLQEVVEWMKRAPMEPGDTLEIRQVFENEDFGAELSPELAAQEQAFREKAGYA